MKHVLTRLDSLRRPRLLIQTARIGAASYRRDTVLRRLLGAGRCPRPAEALTRLLEIEAELDAQRRGGDAAYAATTHVEVMIAMMGEARILRATMA